MKFMDKEVFPTNYQTLREMGFDFIVISSNKFELI